MANRRIYFPASLKLILRKIFCFEGGTQGDYRVFSIKPWLSISESCKKFSMTNS